MKYFFLFLTIVIGCQIHAQKKNSDYTISLVQYQDVKRNRTIPVAIYLPKGEKKVNKIPIIFSHGYGENKGDDYIVDYTYLTEFLASKGYFVVSIQHELKTDDLLAMNQPLKVTRMSNWQRGFENINFVLHEMKKQFPHLNYKKLVIIGHSNGGDMSVLFAHQHPESVNKLITLDNRRMDFPRHSKIKIYTIRSNDNPADSGVLPNDEERKKMKFTIDYSKVNHSSMDNDATNDERAYLTSTILKYLQN